MAEAVAALIVDNPKVAMLALSLLAALLRMQLQWRGRRGGSGTGTTTMGSGSGIVALFIV